MDAVLFLKEWKRMCESKGDTHEECMKCELYKFDCCNTIPSVDISEKFVKIVEKWSDENPSKTMMDDFFEKFPNAPRMPEGHPSPCPSQCGYEKSGCGLNVKCLECWSRPLEVN